MFVNIILLVVILFNSSKLIYALLRFRNYVATESFVCFSNHVPTLFNSGMLVCIIFVVISAIISEYYLY